MHRAPACAGPPDADGIGIPAPVWAVEAGTPEAKQPRSTLSDGRGWSDGSDPLLRTPAQRRLDAVIDALRLGPDGPGRIRELAVAAGIIPVVPGGAGQVPDVGRSRRLPTAARQTAVLVRAIGCIVPHCAMPIARSEIHHLEAWNEGGRTDIDNLAIACTAHHHDLHPGRPGMRSITGMPYVIPPPDIDPAQRPVRNL